MAAELADILTMKRGITYRGFFPPSGAARSLLWALGALVVAALLPPPVHSQMVPPFVDVDSGIPRELEETIRDLVERYESVRALLREQIRINESLFSREEIERAVADLEEELSHARERIAALEDELVQNRLQRQEALDEAAEARLDRDAARGELEFEMRIYREVVESTEVERLLQIGPVFSPQGEIGLLGLVNIPGTNFSVLGGANYRLQEQDYRTFFGATLSFIPQRNLAERWARRRAEAGPAEDDPRDSDG